jgi:erythromycin esterase-like protein
MPIITKSDITDRIASEAYPLGSDPSDYDPLLRLVGEARFVLLGEATHGTHEFYQSRCEITKRLIQEKGFTAIAVEADWPDAYRINRYVRSDSNDKEAIQALGDFKRFPSWMWRNAVVLDFVGWLRSYNDRVSEPEKKVGFYGLDLYSLFASIQAVLTYLDTADPEAAARARYRYSCFDHFGEDVQAYGYASAFNLLQSCEDKVIEQLVDLRKQQSFQQILDGDEAFFAERNAAVVLGAEQYYRLMFRPDISTWNLRDRHMMETLEALDTHISSTEQQAKIVVWEHNSHVGDARATARATIDEINVGQLVRERYGTEAVLMGYSTYNGSVSAASDWGGSVAHKTVRPALPTSYEELFHQTGVPQFFLPLHEVNEIESELRKPRLERAIGVIYRPQSERLSHYFHASLTEQFDAIIHFDTTRAVEPLEKTVEWESAELPETYPSGI